MQSLSNTTKIILIIAIVVIINLISIHVFTRIDLTKDKRFSISNYSKNLVRNLDDKLTIKAYFTKDIPPPYNNIERDVKDKLEEFKAFANRYFQYEFVTTDDEKELVRDAGSYRIPQVQINALENDKVIIKKVVMGLVFLYEDRSETIPLVKDTKNLEYEISSKINKLISQELPTVGFLQGHNEIKYPDELEGIENRLRENYNITAVNLREDNNGLQDVDILVIAGPKEVLSEEEKYLIDQFIIEGKRVIFLIDNVDADLSSTRPTAEFYDNDMKDWFSNYGFNVERDLVYDYNAQNIQVQQVIHNMRQITFMKYPFFINVNNYNKKNMIVKELNPMGLFFASSVDTSYAAADSISVIPLMFTSSNAGIQKGRLDINIRTADQRRKYDKSNIPLGVILKGNFKSFYKGKEIPDTIDTQDFIEDGVENRLLVIGNARFISKNYLSKSNALFFANSIDWMAQEKGLIQIRTKDISSHQLKEVSGGVKNTIKFVVRFVPTILVVIIGFIFWRIKKSRYASMGRYVQ